MVFYEAITRKNLADYRSVILPDAYKELFLYEEEPIEMGYLCIGAREEKNREAKGALVAALETEEDGGAGILVRSVFVRKADRRNGIGRTLLSRLLTVASGICVFPEGEEEAAVTLKIQYLMQEWEAEEFTVFLREFGFTDFAEEAPLYRLTEWELMSLDVLRPAYRANKNTHPFSEADASLRQEIEEELQHTMEPELSFAYVKGDDILGLVLTEELSPGHYLMLDAEHDGSLSDAQMLSLLRTAAAAIEKKTPRFTVTMEPRDPILKGLLSDTPGAVVITPHLAWADVILKKGKAE